MLGNRATCGAITISARASLSIAPHSGVGGWAPSPKNDRLAAAQDKKKGILYGLAGFLGGIILDVGMLEEKLGFKLPLALILCLFGLTIAAILAAVFFVKKSQPSEVQRPFED